MRITLPSTIQRQRRQSGIATLVVLMILSILLIYVMGNARTLHYLGRELRLMEEQQQRRTALRAAIALTNSVPPAVSEPRTPAPQP
jgi:type II secretory pathway component PulK